MAPHLAVFFFSARGKSARRKKKKDFPNLLMAMRRSPRKTAAASKKEKTAEGPSDKANDQREKTVCFEWIMTLTINTTSNQIYRISMPPFSGAVCPRVKPRTVITPALIPKEVKDTVQDLSKDGKGYWFILRSDPMLENPLQAEIMEAPNADPEASTAAAPSERKKNKRTKKNIDADDHGDSKTKKTKKQRFSKGSIPPFPKNGRLQLELQLSVPKKEPITVFSLPGAAYQLLENCSSGVFHVDAKRSENKTDRVLIRIHENKAFAVRLFLPFDLIDEKSCDPLLRNWKAIAMDQLTRQEISLESPLSGLIKKSLKPPPKKASPKKRKGAPQEEIMEVQQEKKKKKKEEEEEERPD